MNPDKRFYVYLMASKSRVLYVGMTGFLMQRVQQHKAGECEGFTKKYNVSRLVYYETFKYVGNAINRETEIKKWRREKKVALIEKGQSDMGGFVGTVGQADATLKSRFLAALGMTTS